MNVFVLYTSFITFHFIVSHTFTAHSPSACQNNLRRSSRREMCPCPPLEVGRMWRTLVHALLELLTWFSYFVHWQGGSSEMVIIYFDHSSPLSFVRLCFPFFLLSFYLFGFHHFMFHDHMKGFEFSKNLIYFCLFFSFWLLI